MTVTFTINPSVIIAGLVWLAVLAGAGVALWWHVRAEPRR